MEPSKRNETSIPSQSISVLLFRLTLTHHSPCIVAVWEVASMREGLIGIFNVAQEVTDEQFIQIPNLPDGDYESLFVDLGVDELRNDESRTISVNNNGEVRVPTVATILHYTNVVLRPQTFYSEIFDFNYYSE